ncbi:MAG: hypothetical protein IKZ49_03695 [Alphaproteobacteria bacterium]|nr:hypothetical protein [Alphaproteobacteria bacterium]
MNKFHRNLNIMSLFTATLLVVLLLFWKTFLNIAVSNILLNGIIIGVSVFGICLCFFQIFKLLPEYKWLHAYFMGRATYGYAPNLLRPAVMALQNMHSHITTAKMSEILDLIAIKIEDERDSVRYITNTLIFLGLLGTFWGLILTLGGFAELMFSLDFNNSAVMQTMQAGLAKPLAGMATAFTSSLLGLAGSLVVGFLGLQLQFAQNTIYQDLVDFMSKYVLQTPEKDNNIAKVAERAPVSEQIYTKISDIYDSLTENGYDIRDLIRINGKYPAIVALGKNEKFILATTNIEDEVLENIAKRIELCFADTLIGVSINTKILCVDNKNSDSDETIVHFDSIDSLKKYLSKHKNTIATSAQEKQDYDAYAEYIDVAIEYLFKPNK